MQEFMLIPQGVLPIGVQLKEQIRWMIAQGKLKPGDCLPSVRELSELLNINRNTVNTVYDELRDEDLIRMGRGRGTEIAESNAVRDLSGLAGLLELLDSTFAQAMERGYSAEEVSRTGMTRAFLLKLHANPGDHIPLVVESGDEVEWLVDQIRTVTGGVIRVLPLAHVRSNPGLAGKRVVTSCHTAPAMRQLGLEDCEITVLGTAIPFRSLLELFSLPAGAAVLFVGQTREAVAWAAEVMEQAGGQHLRVQAAGVKDPDLALLCRQATAIRTMPSVFSEVEALGGARVKALELVLEAGSAEALKAFTVPSSDRR